MRLRYTPIALLLLFTMSLPAMAQWRWGRARPPRSGACFYRDFDYRGQAFCLKEGDRWPSLPAGFNDRITSIRVFGGARLRVFNNTNFSGVSTLIDRDVRDLRRLPVPDNPSRNWNDRISSIAVFRERDEWDRRDRDRDRR